MRDCARRITFHNKLASSIFAAFMVAFPTKVKRRAENFLHAWHQFDKTDNNLDERSKRRKVYNLIYARAFFSAEYNEYFLYGLDAASDPGKLDYVCWYELRHYYKLLNKKGRPDIFDQKEKTYEMFRDFYCREVLYFTSPKQKDIFLSFFQRHSAGVIKPTNKYGGAGVEIVRLSNELNPEQLWSTISTRIPFLLEELIEQAPEMNAFYPLSVNTIRYNTFYHDGKLTRLQAVFRIGRGGSMVDNATSGGIYALVDTETGRILGPARSFKNELYETHPDTGAPFEGNDIPRWDELNALVEKVVCVIPEQKQVGWDFALSKNGWVLVEGNAMPALQDFDLDHGMRKLVESTFGTVIPMWK